MNTAYLLLGSNLGKRESLLSEAVGLIKKDVGKMIVQSSLYETAPWGNENQSNFINQVICIDTHLSSEKLLSEILAIEKTMGRERSFDAQPVLKAGVQGGKKWEARIIDIDILFFNSEVINTPDLTVPHPHLHERRFTLVPLTEIAGEFVHPLLKKKVTQLLSECKDNLKVSRL